MCAKHAKSREKAVALEYDSNLTAPEVVAKGEGFIARKIIEIARENDVPIVEDAALVSALISLELGDTIPSHLYEAVARILAFLYKLDKEKLVRK